MCASKPTSVAVGGKGPRERGEGHLLPTLRICLSCATVLIFLLMTHDLVGTHFVWQILRVVSVGSLQQPNSSLSEVTLGICGLTFRA